MIGLADDGGFAGTEKALNAPVAGEIDAVRSLDPDQVGNGPQRGMQQCDAIRLWTGVTSMRRESAIGNDDNVDQVE